MVPSQSGGGGGVTSEERSNLFFMPCPARTSPQGRYPAYGLRTPCVCPVCPVWLSMSEHYQNQCHPTHRSQLVQSIQPLASAPPPCSLLPSMHPSTFSLFARPLPILTSRGLSHIPSLAGLHRDHSPSTEHEQLCKLLGQLLSPRSCFALGPVCSLASHCSTFPHAAALLRTPRHRAQPVEQD